MDKVIKCMLAMQRYPWEQGVCAQALYEAGLEDLWIPMAYDAVKRMSSDGRLAMVGGDVSVSDPAANGEVCLRAYEKTGDEFYKKGAKKMLEYLLYKAPKTGDAIICHNTVSFYEGYSPYQIWIDGLYMVPPFLAVMGHMDEAFRQTMGYMRHLYDSKTRLFYHIHDDASGRYVRQVRWATGNGWALLGLSRIIEEAKRVKRDDIKEYLAKIFRETLDAMLKYQLPDGRFNDVLDDPESFPDGTSAMMMATAVYRGYVGGYLDFGMENADRALETVSAKIDDMGLVREVSGCPDFVSSGTSAEAQAAYIMARAWKDKWRKAE